MQWIDYENSLCHSFKAYFRRTGIPTFILPIPESQSFQREIRSQLRREFHPVTKRDTLMTYDTPRLQSQTSFKMSRIVIGWNPRCNWNLISFSVKSRFHDSTEIIMKFNYPILIFSQRIEVLFLLLNNGCGLQMKTKSFRRNICREIGWFARKAAKCSIIE